VNTLSAKQQTRPKPAATPVTAHRLFPAIVALWFAALLGIGSLVVPPEKLSALVGALGIPRLIHAAAPPLGFTARALLALVMAGAGAIFGVLIGRWITRRHTVQTLRKTDPTRGRQEKPKRTYAYDPVEHPAEAPPEVVTGPAHRSPLRASEAFADIEPLTGSTEYRHDMHSLQADPMASESLNPEYLADDHFAVLGAPQAEAFDLAPFDRGDETIDAEFDEPVEHFARPAPFTTLVETNDLAGAQPEPALQHASVAVPAHADVRETLGQAPLESLGTVQLVERLALAMAAAAQAGYAPVTQAPVAEIDARAVPVEEPLELEPFAESADDRDAEPRFVAPADQPAELHRPHVNDPHANESWSSPDFADHETDRPADPWTDHQAAPIPAAASATPTRPSILDPIAGAWDDASFEDEDAPTIAPPRFLSARPSTSDAATPPASDFTRPALAGEAPFGARHGLHAAAGSVVGTDDTLDAAGEAASEDRYPSLLDIQPMAREAIRIPASAPATATAAKQAEPIVMFPNAGARGDAPFAPPPASTLQSRRGLPFQAPMDQGSIGQGSLGTSSGLPVTPPELPADPVDAEDADRALRAALATLQRMSGGR